MGGGACIATALDLRIGADDCFMQYPEIDLGMNLMWQSLPLCIHLVGPARAKRLVIGGERVFAPTLLQWGVLDECVPVQVRNALVGHDVSTVQRMGWGGISNGELLLRGEQNAANHPQQCDRQHRARPSHTRLLLPLTLIHLRPVEWDDIF